MDTFSTCTLVNQHLLDGNHRSARDELIQLLDVLEQESQPYPRLVNHLIRETGLYPYIQPTTADWDDRYAYEAFKVDVGDDEPATLHLAQSQVLRRLLEGESLAVSAPTSFGKSFIIDSFIALSNPTNIMIIVPTIALMDETRRRLYRKFSPTYNIITTADAELGPKNILIFPQERALQYSERIDHLDMLVIDEFYKASKAFDKERASSLLSAIMQLEKKALQRYFLAPNISALGDNPFTKGMDFLSLDFNTVFLEKHELYHDIGNDEALKSQELLRILDQYPGKTLIYAGTYSNIDKVATLLISNTDRADSDLVDSFCRWLGKNYDPNWNLTNLAARGVGVHNGRLHRSLSQIQVKLFEEDSGLDVLVSTSSIIEGVNTSAENVVIWRNRSGNTKLNDFTYKNIIGRGGRMFRHFVGNAFILEAPPESQETQLNLELTEELTGELHDRHDYFAELHDDTKAEIRAYHAEMNDALGPEILRHLKDEGKLQNSDTLVLREIVRSLRDEPDTWRSLGFLNSHNPEKWDSALYALIGLQPAGWEVKHSKFVGFVKALANNWELSIPELLVELDDLDLGIEDLFKLERNATFKLGALANDVNVLQRYVLGERAIDISRFAHRVSYAFLPPVVYQLEEFGLPRMITKKIQKAGLFDFENEDISIDTVLSWMKTAGMDLITDATSNLDKFDHYILSYFFEGISPGSAAREFRGQ